uniref:GatB/YqeY domain-containing protein n=1 Tax=candidate division WWE3 bacterium TaxID=2053526 RepID=A0A832DRU3_UNCKA
MDTLDTLDTLTRIKNDLTESLKAGDVAKALSLRYLLAEIHNAEIAKGKDAVLTEEELAAVLQKQAKQRFESIDAYQKGGREDLVLKEKRELEMIRAYLPAQMSADQIRELARVAIQESGAVGMTDMGKVMGVLMPKVQGRAEGSVVSKVVRELLSQP